MPRGGPRPGSGAPIGNTNALKHGRRSRYVQHLMRSLIHIPEFRELLAIALRMPPPSPPLTPLERLHQRLVRFNALLERTLNPSGRPRGSTSVKRSKAQQPIAYESSATPEETPPGLGTGHALPDNQGQLCAVNLKPRNLS